MPGHRLPEPQLFCGHSDRPVHSRSRSPLMILQVHSHSHPHKREAFPLDEGCNHAVPPKRRQNKKVSFCSKICIRQIRHLTDMSEEEIEATWITQDDFAATRRNCVTTVKKYVRGEVNCGNEHEFCMRGLESRTREGAAARKRAKEDSCRAVLEEQELQHDACIDDAEALMKVYMIHSDQAQNKAYHFGIVDQKEAQEIHATTGTEQEDFEDVVIGF